jgi:hypothetical protein
MEKKLVRRTFSVDPDDYEAFEKLGEENSLSAAWLIRKSMKEFLDKVRAGEGVTLDGTTGTERAEPWIKMY